jgi:hypothetical protein
MLWIRNQRRTQTRACPVHPVTPEPQFKIIGVHGHRTPLNGTRTAIRTGCYGLEHPLRSTDEPRVRAEPIVVFDATRITFEVRVTRPFTTYGYMVETPLHPRLKARWA